MSLKARDRRPKIVSYHTSYDGLDIAAKQDILWPCHAFNISIPVKNKRSLNIFEETILKLTDIESGDTERLSHITSLNVELVSFIQNRLQQLGLVSERYDISKDGQALLNEWENDSAGNREYEVATVLVDLQTGQLLPYVSGAAIRIENIERIDDHKGWVTFSVGTMGRPKKIRARQIRPGMDSFWNVIPHSHDIVKAIREFRKRYKRYAILNPNIDRYPPPLPMAEALSVQKTPELIYLHCKVLIQKGNPGIVVTDGLGYGYSETFANYLKAQNWQWLIDLKSKGLVENIGAAMNNNTPPKDNRFGRASQKYPQIYQAVQRAYLSYSKASNIKVCSTNDELELKRQTGNAAISLYEAIEWTLRQVVSDNPIEEWECTFSCNSFRDNNKLLKELAAKLGFYVTERNQALLHVDKGKVRSYERGVAKMQTLLALSIAGAINDSNHPMHRLAVLDSECLSFIYALKQFRDPLSHGDIYKVALPLGKLEGYRDRTMRTIQSLIPSLSYSPNSSTSMEVPTKDINQIRLKARIELDTCLGLSVVNLIRPELREELIKLIILDQNNELDNKSAQKYINMLAAALQLAFYEIILNNKSSGIMEGNLRSIALERAVTVGYAPSYNEIPHSVAKVNLERIHYTVQGRSTTLGAHLIALFVLCSNDELQQLYKKLPDLFSLVDKLQAMRGHGNAQLYHITKDSLMNLKNSVFNAIKIIVEV